VAEVEAEIVVEADTERDTELVIAIVELAVSDSDLVAYLDTG